MFELFTEETVRQHRARQPGSGRRQSARKIQMKALILWMTWFWARIVHRRKIKPHVKLQGYWHSLLVSVQHYSQDLQLKCLKKRRAQELTIGKTIYRPRTLRRLAACVTRQSRSAQYNSCGTKYYICFIANLLRHTTAKIIESDAWLIKILQK